MIKHMWHSYMFLEYVYESSSWLRASFSLSSIKLWRKCSELSYEPPIADALNALVNCVCLDCPAASSAKIRPHAGCRLGQYGWTWHQNENSSRANETWKPLRKCVKTSLKHKETEKSILPPSITVKISFFSLNSKTIHSSSLISQNWSIDLHGRLPRWFFFF
jgi:hypothetical protein